MAQIIQAPTIDRLAVVIAEGSIHTFVENADQGLTCFRYNNNVTDTPCLYGHGYVVKYGQNYRLVVFDMISNQSYTSYSNNSGSSWSSWYSLDTARSTITSLSSDTEIIDLSNGAYQISLGSASSYIPSQWGVLTVDKSNNAYGKFTFITTGSPPRVFERVAHCTNKTWYHGWYATSCLYHCSKNVAFTSGTATVNFSKNVCLINVNTVANGVKLCFSRTSGNTGYQITMIGNTSTATLNIEFWYAYAIVDENPAPIN